MTINRRLATPRNRFTPRLPSFSSSFSPWEPLLLPPPPRPPPSSFSFLEAPLLLLPLLLLSSSFSSLVLPQPHRHPCCSYLRPWRPAVSHTCLGSAWTRLLSKTSCQSPLRLLIASPHIP